LAGIHRFSKPSDRIAAVSDFGFDAYALDDTDPGEHPHPLEIARDLIARGQPRAALEALSLHHDQLADDPEYLLICSEAWRADGDTLRAQQALLGAARLAPEDPRPLLWLSELLGERGEHDKAKLVLDKARALEVAAADADEQGEDVGTETADDLIAFAERQERRSQAVFTPRQVLLALLALGALGVLIAGIATLTRTGDTDPGPVAAVPSAQTLPVAQEELAAEPIAIEARDAEPLREPLSEPEVEPAPPIPPPATTVETAEPPADSAATPPPSPKAKSKPRPPAKVPAATREPDAALVGKELASADVAQLTSRGDTLYAQGHTGIATSYYRRALELDPDYAPALVGMGQSILRAKKYSDAMRNASRALQLARGVDSRPGLEAIAIYQMGRVHYERGERDAARRLFRQSISLPGTPPEAWFYLGEALSSDNSPAAREAYEKYLELVSQGHLAERARRAIQ
jgi:tetratricopeptide (TPR) repeat protein